MEEKHKLPCGCEEVPLHKLIGDYSCSKCGEAYWYSFCWEEVVQEAVHGIAKYVEHARIGGNGIVKYVINVPMA